MSTDKEHSGNDTSQEASSPELRLLFAKIFELMEENNKQNNKIKELEERYKTINKKTFPQFLKTTTHWLYNEYLSNGNRPSPALAGLLFNATANGYISTVYILEEALELSHEGSEQLKEKAKGWLRELDPEWAKTQIKMHEAKSCRLSFES